MLLAIILIYVCYFFKFSIPIIVIAWVNLYWEFVKIYLGFFKTVDKDEK